MKKIKVVHIVEAFEGGVYTYFKNLSHFFGNNDKIETFILYSDRGNLITPSKVENEFSSDVHLIEIIMTRELSFSQDLKSTSQLIKILKKIKPDIIHLHSSKASVLGRFAHIFLNKKCQVYYTPHGYSFVRKDISEYKRGFYKFIETTIAWLFGGVTIACGDTEYEMACKLGKSKLVRNGVNIEDIIKYYKKSENQKLTIGIVGRITEARNPELFNSIALKYKNFNFLWIGDGNLRNKITSPNIRITGWLLSERDVFKHLNTIDIYIQTSLWEGLPIAILEAMALKKPVMATNIIGNKDIVLHNETGFLFEENDDDLEKYFRLLEDEKIRKKMGEAGFKRCENLFDINKNFNDLYFIYKNDFLPTK